MVFCRLAGCRCVGEVWGGRGRGCGGGRPRGCRWGRGGATFTKASRGRENGGEAWRRPWDLVERAQPTAQNLGSEQGQCVDLSGGLV